MKKKIDAAKLQACIFARENVSIRMAGIIADWVSNDFDEQLCGALDMWMDGTLTGDFSADGCALQDIIEDTGASIFEALCMLNMQIRRSEQIDKYEWILRSDAVYGVLGEN